MDERLNPGSVDTIQRCEHQFRVWHLLLWMLASGVYLTIYKALREPLFGFDEVRLGWMAAFLTGLAALNSLGAGGLIVGGVVLAWRLARAERLPRHPGQVLLSIQFAVFALSLLASAFMKLLPRESWPYYDHALMILEAVLTCIAAAAYAGGLRLPCRPRWKLVFGVIASSAALAAAVGLLRVVLFSWFFDSPLYSQIDDVKAALPIVDLVVVVPALIYASQRDIKHHVPRDWVHWLGVVLEGWYRVIGCVGHLGLSFAQSSYFEI